MRCCKRAGWSCGTLLLALAAGVGGDRDARAAGPAVTWDAPADDDVATTDADVRARCDGACALELRAADDRVLARGTGTLATNVSLAFADGTAAALTLVARDASGTTELTRNVFVESGPGLVLLDRAAPPYSLRDAELAPDGGGRTLLLDADHAPWVTARVPGHVGGADALRLGGVPAFPLCYDAELTRNAVVIACQSHVLVWRGAGDAASLGAGVLAAVGDRVVAAFVPDGLRVSALDGGARTVAFDVAAPDRAARVALAPQGGVAFVDAVDGALALFADWHGQLTLVRDHLPSVAHVSHDGALTGYVRGDGARSVWLHHDGYDEQLSPASDPARPNDAVHVRGGFVAYERRARADGASELVRRDPAGREETLLACGGRCFVEALGDDGTVALVDEAAGRRLVAPAGGPASIVSSSQGRARWGGAGMLVFLGRDVFRVGGPSPEANAAVTAGGAASADVVAPAAAAAPAEPPTSDRGAVAGGCSTAPTTREASRAATGMWLLLLAVGATLASRRRP